MQNDDKDHSLSRTSLPSTGTAVCETKNADANAEKLNMKLEATDTSDIETSFRKERLTGGKENLYLIVIGHVDAGKSTIMGHVLHKLGYVSPKLMNQYEHETKKVGKQSFVYAWILDETGEERNRGVTINIGRNKFKTSNRTVTLLDAPGHKDFIPNMVTGVNQADVAILVVDATCGEFETGFESGGQSREHTLIVRSLGISQLGVAVNKMDNVNWSQSRFEDVCKRLGLFLRQVGFKDSDVCYVPCSGLTGENLIDKPCTDSPLMSWYSGPTFVEMIDNFKPPNRPIQKPFRMCVNDIYKGNGTSFCISGRVETGHITVGKKVLVLPQGEVAVLKGLIIDDDNNENVAYAGDYISGVLSNCDVENIYVGSVICDVQKPMHVTTKFEAKIVLFNVLVPVTSGYTVILHLMSFVDCVVIKKIKAQMHRVTGQIIKRNPRCLLKNSTAIVLIETSRPICIELYENVREFGRFMLRDAGMTIAAGLITKVL